MVRSLPIIGVPNLFGGESVLDFLASQLQEYEGVNWLLQEPSGLVAGANNTALTLGRDVALKTYADYTAGADWSNPSGQLARHVAPAVETLQQDDILAAGKTYQATVVITDRTAGSVTITDGGAAIAVNGTTLRTITSTGADFIITPTTDFDGDINLATTLVQQTDILASTAYPSAELLVDGDMEAATTAAWTAVNAASLTKETVSPYQGTRVLRVARNGTDNPIARQEAVLVAGRRYNATGVARSDGNATPSFRAIAAFWTGTTSTDWQPFDFEFVSTGTRVDLRSNTSTGTEHTEWDAVTVTEVNPLSGTHTGVTVGQSIGPDGLLAGSYDATNDYTNVSSAELNSLLAPNTSGQVEIYAQVSGAGVWTDNTLRVLLNFQVDANNYIRLSKNTSDELQWDYKAGGTLESVVLAVTPLTPFLLTLKWNVAGTGLRALYNGAQTGSNQAIAGTWVGNLAATTSVLGALNTSGDNVWNGLLALASDYRAEATDADSKRLAQLLGVYGG